MRSTREGEIDASSVGELQHQIAMSRYRSAPNADWAELVAEYYSAGGYEETVAYWISPDGQIARIEPDADVNRFHDLREAMATPEHGAWFAAKLVVEPDGRHRFTFDYDFEPPWEVPPSPQTYLDDLAAHPRPADRVPAWHPGHTPGGTWVPVRYDQTGLAGQTARLLTDLPTDDAGVPADLPDGTAEVVVVDDTPNPTLTLRVHPVGSAADTSFVRFDQLAVRS
jgi:hypothetical protein